ncbi:hypothetical protein [Saccharothrix sp. HUAS TT1]|uniref:hypothetical protein n=1 Tax=unclassified Saccharothrix TaxID=2593673 RepID=UPI00345B7887
MAEPESVPARVVNEVTGPVHTVVQAGVVFGGVHLAQVRKVSAVLLVAVWLPLLITVVALVPGDSARKANPAVTPTVRDVPTPPVLPSATPSTTSSAPPPAVTVETRMVELRVRDHPVEVFEGVRMAVGSAAFISVDQDGATCAGSNIGSGCAVVAGGSTTALSGVADLTVITPTLSCTVGGLHVSESAVVVDADGGWTRIVLLDFGPVQPNTPMLVQFDLSRGHGAAPLTPKPCVPQ